MRRNLWRVRRLSSTCTHRQAANVPKWLTVCIAVGGAGVIALCAEHASTVDSLAAHIHMSAEDIKRAGSVGLDMTRLPASPGLHIVPLDHSPFVGALGEQAAQEFAGYAKNGVRIVPPGELPDLRGANRSTTDKRHHLRSLEAIRPQLRYEPISVQGTILEKAPLVDVTTAGGVRDGLWTGVTRAWEVPGLGYVQLDESEYRETGGSITVVEEWLNTEVNGSPASIQAKKERRGKALVSLGWITDSTTYRLDLQPRDPVAVKANEESLLALARSLGM